MASQSFTVGGVKFESDDRGSVTITSHGDTLRFNEMDWAHIVAGVSAAGPAHFEAARALHRSAVTGRFVSADDAAANPDTTVTERD